MISFSVPYCGGGLLNISITQISSKGKLYAVIWYNYMLMIHTVIYVEITLFRNKHLIAFIDCLDMCLVVPFCGNQMFKHNIWSFSATEDIIQAYHSDMVVTGF